MLSAINLSELRPQAFVEELSFEEILAQMVIDLNAALPEPVINVESEPLFKLLEVFAYRELKLRQRINDSVKATSLAHAKGDDLDHAPPVAVARRIITPANNNTVPPTPAVYESDDSLRRRKQLAAEAFTSAGSKGAYLFHTLETSPEIKDASITRPEPGVVRISLLSHSGNGTADSALESAVFTKVGADDIRCLNDTLQVQSAQIVDYTIDAELIFYSGPDRDLVMANARTAIESYIDKQHALRAEITRSGIHAALHQPGVQKVNLNQPADNLQTTELQAPFCTNIALTDGGIYE